MASAARPSILVVRGDGLPRFARSDGIFALAVAEFCSWHGLNFSLLSQTIPRIF
jgi:hypothetical protein